MAINYDYEPKHIGPRIKIIQEYLRITTKDLSSNMRVSKATIYKYKQGKNIVPVNNCFFLIKNYRINPLFLFFGDDTQGIVLPIEKDYSEAMKESKRLIESALDYTTEEERRMQAYQISEILCCLLKD